MSVSVPVIDHIDPSARLIYLLAGVDSYHPVTDIYHEVRNLRRVNEALRPYPVFVTAGGNVPKNIAGTKRTPRYAVFRNCKVVLTGDTLVEGEQLYADANDALVGSGPDCIDRVFSPADAYVDYQPPDSEVIVVEGTSVPPDIAAALATISGDLALVAKIMRNKRITDETTGVLTIYDDDGVTPWLTANLYESSDTSQQYRAQGIQRVERLT